MIPRISFTFLLFTLTTALETALPEVRSYAKVSRNGQETKSTGSGPFSWIARTFTGSNLSTTAENEGRSIKDIAITVSPVYVPPRTPNLKNGEAVDYSLTKSVPRYSTIDKELLTKLDSIKSKVQIQERFHPPASFEHSAKPLPSSPSESPGPDSRPNSSPPISEYSKPIYSGTYDFKPSSFDQPKDIYLSDKPISRPIGIDSYSPIIVDDKPSEPYKSQLDSYPSNHDTDLASYSSGPTYDDHAAPKPIQFDGPSLNGDTYPHDHDHYHHEVIYDHLPEYHHPLTTPEPEMNDQRLDKRPYSYYFIGKKLWYIPLYFSIYFIIYIAALVLKSIARHKIAFPAHLAEAAGHGRKDTNNEDWWDLTNRVLGGMERFLERFGKGS